ncbi:MAG: hypothetical protein AAF081_07585 [Actinomycetota bacterium]
MTPRFRAWLVAATGVAAALSLLLPWARSGGRTRSTIELLSSASAIDLLDGWTRAVLVGGWCLVVLGAAVGLLGVAWDRPTVARSGLVVLGPALALATLAVIWSPLAVEWGAWVGSGLGATASMGSGLLRMSGVAQREGRSR